MENYSRRNRHSSTRLLNRNTTVLPLESSSSTPKSQSSENSKTSSRKTTNKKSGENSSIKSGGDGFVRFLPRSTSKVVEVKRRSRSTSTSPSAWALSPGRSPSRPCSSPAHVETLRLPKSPATLLFDNKVFKTTSTGVSGVLRYFKHKKVSPVLEEEYHHYRLMHNRLLQWRFVNARADASMANVNRVAQKKLFNGWVRISQIRNFIMENRIEIQRLKHEIKLYHVFQSEMNFLNQWSKLEPKNVEAVGRVVRKLSATSNCLPLIGNAEGDVISMNDVISSAIEVMNNIENVIQDMHLQVERACFLITELSIMLKEQKHFIGELEKRMTMVASMEVWEKTMRVHYLQLAN